MAIVIATSNYLVQFPLNEWITVAAFTYPVTFVITDIANKLFGKARAYQVVFFGFIFGVVLSFYSSEPRIAIASGCAFLIAQLIDVHVFDSLRNGVWWRAPAISSAIASCVDTLLFFCVAFIGTGVPWISLSIGDLAVKTIMLVLLLPMYRWSCFLLTNKFSVSIQ